MKFVVGEPYLIEIDCIYLKGLSASKDFRFTDINKDFSFCDTYPQKLVVPKSVTDEQLRKVGEFRSKHRIPVVSWIKYDSSTHRAALLRSSQPLVGLTQKRSDADEEYLNTFFKLNTSNSKDKLFIVDARPHVNAVANITTGGGYESEDNYENCELLFLNIQNIHVMRESLRKIFEMALPVAAPASNSVASGNLISNATNHLGNIIGPATGSNRATVINNGSNSNATINFSSNSSSSLYDDKNFFLNLENSKWLEHIRFLLNGALKIVRYIIYQQASVLVHCSDGWDRTAQVKNCF